MLLLAPMQGLTELIFRETYQQCFPGAFDCAISPFLSLTHGNLSQASVKVADVDVESNKNSIPVIPQILGHEPVEFVSLANRLFDLGHPVVNWNIGCPVRRVAAKHRGSGILPYPAEIQEILTFVVPRLKGVLSVKMRLGYNSPDECDAVIPILNQFPIKEIIVHPRIGRQQYGGQVNLDKFAEVVKMSVHKIVYNGDICTLGDYKKIRTLFPDTRDVMIGRGALYNPLLPYEIRRNFKEDFTNCGCISASSASEFIIALTNKICSLDISKESCIRKIKEYWCLLAKSLHCSDENRRKVLHSTDLAQIRSLIFDMAK